MQNERNAASTKGTHLESDIPELQRMVNHPNAAADVSKLEAQVRVQEKEAKRTQAEEADRLLQKQVDLQAKDPSACSPKAAKER
eukprot:6184308-Pleurochrysis_carterae.AAC.7